MDQLLKLYSWFTCLLIFVILLMDIFLMFKFRRYYQASGFGIVTCTLLSLVCVQALAAIIYGTTSAIIIISGARYSVYVYLLKDAGISWLTSSTLLHTIAITFLRIYSVSFGNRFLKFVRSKSNIALVVMKMWFVSLALTLVTITSGTSITYSVFYIGLLVTGLFAVIAFFVTIDTSLNTSQSVLENSRELRNPIVPSRRKNNFHVIKNPRKTYTLFSGIVISFTIFTLPTAAPNLYFTLKGQHLTQATSLIVSLWLLVGVVFNSLWILMRLRSRVNDTTGFYARWTLEKDKQNVIVHFNRNKNDFYSTNTPFVGRTKLLEEKDPETENETI